MWTHFGGYGPVSHRESPLPLVNKIKLPSKAVVPVFTSMTSAREGFLLYIFAYTGASPVLSVLALLVCCCCCWSHSVVSDSLQPHGLQPTRLLHPWDFPGRNTGVGCHCLLRLLVYVLLSILLLKFRLIVHGNTYWSVITFSKASVFTLLNFFNV